MFEEMSARWEFITIILVTIGIITLLCACAWILIWPVAKLSAIDSGQDDLLEDMKAVKKKLNIKDEA